VTDQQLMETYRTDNCQRSFTILHGRHNDQVIRWARRYINEPEDVAQDTWLQVFKYRHQYDTSRPFRPWLYMITKQSAVNRLRKRKRQTPLAFDPVDPRSETELTPLVHQHVEQLEKDQRAVVVGLYFEGRTLPELSESLGITVAVVRSLKRRALRVLSTYC